MQTARRDCICDIEMLRVYGWECWWVTLLLFRRLYREVAGDRYHRGGWNLSNGSGGRSPAHHTVSPVSSRPLLLRFKLWFLSQISCRDERTFSIFRIGFGSHIRISFMKFNIVNPINVVQNMNCMFSCFLWFYISRVFKAIPRSNVLSILNANIAQKSY